MLRQMDQTFDSSIPWMEDQAIRIASSSQTSRRLGPRSSMERKSPSQSLPKPTSSTWEVDLWEVARVDVGWSLAGKKTAKNTWQRGRNGWFTSYCEISTGMDGQCWPFEWENVHDDPVDSGATIFSDRAIWFVSSAGTTERCTLNKNGHYWSWAWWR